MTLSNPFALLPYTSREARTSQALTVLRGRISYVGQGSCASCFVTPFFLHQSTLPPSVISAQDLCRVRKYYQAHFSMWAAKWTTCTEPDQSDKRLGMCAGSLGCPLAAKETFIFLPGDNPAFITHPHYLGLAPLKI